MNINISEIVIDGIDYIKRVNQNLNLIINAINSNDKEKATKNYYDLLEGLEWIKDVLAHIEVLTNIDYSDIRVNKQNSEIIIKQYNDYLNVIDIMFEQNNFDELVSSLENELPKILRKIITIFNKIKFKIEK